MPCTKPVLVRKKVGNKWDVPHYYPCKRCLDCRKTRGREWTLRLLMERLKWHDCAFVTLTYSDKFLPKDRSLHPEDLTKFIKRLRKAMSKSKRKLKYYACGEYGSDKNTFRPHFHLIIFGLSQCKTDMELLQNCWRFCESWQFDWKYSNGQLKRHSGLEPVTPADIQYVCGYVDKKLYDKTSDYEERGVVPPFSRQSQHLGEAFFLEHFQDFLRGSVRLRENSAKIPSHFKKKYKDDIPGNYYEKRNILRSQLQYLEEHGFDVDSIKPWEISSTFYNYCESIGMFEALDNLNNSREKYRGLL